jgi:predicted MPP superfamily phosphohydrolase
MSSSKDSEPRMNIATYIIWISIVVVVLGLGYAYLAWRLVLPMKLAAPWQQYALVGLGVMFFLPLVLMIFMRANEALMAPLSWVAYIGLGFLSLVFTILVVRDVVWMGSVGATKIVALVRSPATAATDASRREFLLQTTNLAVLGLAASFTAYGIYQARRKPGIVNLTIPLGKLPGEFDGFRIVQITDIHAGLTVQRDWVETIVQEVQKLTPDLIAFTGDLVDGSVPHLRDDVAPFAELQAPYGKFFVTGNHEYYSGVEPWVEEVRRLGYDVLNNEHRIVQRNGSSFVLAGVTDHSGGQFLASHRSDPIAAAQGAPADMVKILMAHQPRALYPAEPVGYDLIISGHTHGGQFFPWNFLATIGQPFIKGLHNVNGTWLYVSKGTGYWGPPVRLGARSEITVFTLKKA